ncbi:MAG: PRC-barrel domain protein [Lentisphaerae bacterium ADurb.BinA184]|nr:MAG: PRC-barrel domain protein [Lentisphaerae bacterium ADurb.BinA184]
MKQLYGVTVASQDDKDIGIVKDLVIEPRSRVVTHLVVQQGLLFNADRLVPAALIDDGASRGRRLVLTVTARELEECNPPEYRIEEYVELADEGLRSSQGVGGAVWRRPQGVGTAEIPYPTLVPPGFAPMTPEAVVAVPLDGITLERGSPVRTADDRPIGTVRDVITDDSEAITHIVLGEGTVFSEPRLIPVDWVARIEDNAIVLAVNKAVIDRLR